MKYVFISFLFLCAQDTSSQLTLEGKLDSIIENGIDSMAFPGAQLYVLHHDSVIIHKAYGHHRYNRLNKVSPQDLYDLASLTKVMSGLPVLMKLYDKGIFNLDAPASNYLQDWEKTNKGNLTFRHILSHQAGLEPYIVFWAKTKNADGTFKRKTFRSKSNKRYNIRIHDSLFLHKKYQKKMWSFIKDSPVKQMKTYRYSGLSFLQMPDMISSMINSDFETQLHQTFYSPLGIDRLLYNPLDYFPAETIIPTERDTFFRKTLVHGTVHDEAAAMLDGVSCNAGLFGNAESVAKLFHMYLRYGELNGKQYINAETVKLFTRYQFPKSPGTQ